MSESSHEERAKAAYEAQVQAIEGIHALVSSDRLRAAHEKASALGRNVLQEELGHFGRWTGGSYELDEERRDLLLAHARQDVAACFGLLSSLARELSEIQAELRLSRKRQLILIWSLAIFATVSLGALWIIASWSVEIFETVFRHSLDSAL